MSAGQEIIKRLTNVQLLLGILVLFTLTCGSWLMMHMLAQPGKDVSILGLVRYTKRQELQLSAITKEHTARVDDLRYLIRQSRQALGILRTTYTAREVACNEQLSAATHALGLLSKVVNKQEVDDARRKRAIAWLELAVSMKAEHNDTLTLEVADLMQVLRNTH